jgi:hypothetical protein
MSAALTVGFVGRHGGGVGGLEEVAEVLPLAAARLTLGVLVSRLYLLERQRRRQHHLRLHDLRLHPPRTFEIQEPARRLRGPGSGRLR